MSPRIEPAFVGSRINNGCRLGYIKCGVARYISVKMSLITVSAIVKADASFDVGPYGLPPKKSIAVILVPSAPGMFQVCSIRGGYCS
jgi:hypothetical protein